MNLNKKITYLQTISSGISCAKNLNLAVCMLARDCAKNAKKNIKKCIYLKKYFANLKLYILENDSKDNTRTILERYAKKYDFVCVYSLQDYPQYLQTKTEQLLQSNIRDTGKQRMKRMALLRDLLLEKALGDLQFSADVFAQIDIDVVAFDTNGFLHSFASYNTWDCVLANGRDITFNCYPLTYNHFFDSYAFLPYYTQKKAPNSSEIHLQQPYAPLTKYMPLYPVKSAFGGIGIYKKNVAHALAYYKSAQKDAFSFCEHLSAFKQLRKKGYKKIYINPAMLVYYSSPFKVFLLAIKIGNTHYKSQLLSFIIKVLHFFALPLIVIHNFKKKIKHRNLDT